MSAPMQRYRFTPNERTEEIFGHVVVVPAGNARKLTNSYSSDTMDFRSSGHRQPTEHPNDKPPSANDGGYRDVRSHSENHLLNHFGNLSVRTPSEHGGQAFGLHNQAMMQSKQRVAEWQSQAVDVDDSKEESFVIDHYGDTLDSSHLDSEDYGNAGRFPRRSSSISSSSLQQDFSHRTTPEDLSRSEYDTREESSDDEVGLQKSMTNIVRPPDVESSCSRQNSNGSQSSLDSSISFHTVYPSGDNHYTQPKSIARTRDRNRAPHQAVSPPPVQTDTPPNPTSGRLPVTTSTEQFFARSQSQPGPYGYNNRSPGQSGVRQINQRADEASRQEHAQKPTSVFITYAEERNDKNFKKLVLQLTRTLLSNGIQVRLDMLESTLMSMSVSSWLDDNIQKCDFVVVCVSPSYKSEVAEQQLNVATPDPHSLHTRYIYNRLLTEYIQNGSFNYRFIPVLIGKATRKDLPSLCLDTHVYEWPKDFEAIIYRLFKKEKYIQPKVGPPPRCTVETYDSYDERVMNAQSSSRGYR